MNTPVRYSTRGSSISEDNTPTQHDATVVIAAYCSCNVWELRENARDVAAVLHRTLGTQSVHRILGVAGKCDLYPSQDVASREWTDHIDPAISVNELFSACALSITSKKRKEHGDQWAIYLDNRPHTGRDGKYQPQIVVTINSKVFDELKASKSQAFITELASGLFSDSRVDSGLIDIGVPGDISYGLHFAMGPVGPSRWHRHLNRAVWEHLTFEERASVCRGVYWGTYLGPRLVERFPDNATADDWFYNRKLKEPSIFPFILDTACGGRLFALSGTPVTLHERTMTANSLIRGSESTSSEIGARLWRRLRAANLLA